MKKIQISDRILQQFQTNVSEAVDPLQNNLLMQGHFIQNVTLTSGITNIVPIGLTQPLTGWFITRLKANSVIWDSQDSNMSPSQTLQLLCSNTCVVNLYVF